MTENRLKDYEYQAIVAQEARKAKDAIERRVARENEKRDTAAQEARIAALKAEAERISEPMDAYFKNSRRYKTQLAQIVDRLESIDFEIQEIQDLRGA